MPNADLEPNGIEITMSEIDGSITSVRLGDNMDPNDPEVQELLRGLLGPITHYGYVDDVIRNLQAHSAQMFGHQKQQEDDLTETPRLTAPTPSRHKTTRGLLLDGYP